MPPPSTSIQEMMEHKITEMMMAPFHFRWYINPQISNPAIPRYVVPEVRLGCRNPPRGCLETTSNISSQVYTFGVPLKQDSHGSALGF